MAIVIGFGLAQFLAWREEHKLRASEGVSHTAAIEERIREVNTASSLVTSFQSQLAQSQQELQTERDQNAGSSILIRIKDGHFKTTVQHTGSAHDGGEPVYTRTVCVSLLVSFTNTRPRRVTLDSYELIVELSGGEVIRANGYFAGDPLESQRLLGSNAKDFQGPSDWSATCRSLMD